jgi:hypothetical protein
VAVMAMAMAAAAATVMASAAGIAAGGNLALTGQSHKKRGEAARTRAPLQPIAMGPFAVS